MRDIMLNALKSYYVGNINRHIANVEVYLRMTVGIGEHSDIQETIDKEIEKITADINIAVEQVEIAKAQADEEYVSMLGALDKELGYNYTIDPNTGFVDRDTIQDAGDGMLDAQREKIQEEVDLLQSQDLLAYTERVLKDKQTAKIGLDNVMKQSENLRLSDPNHIYTPQYVL